MSLPAISKARVDELIRQRLGLSDLSDPRRVATALARRFPDLERKFVAVDSGTLFGATPPSVGVRSDGTLGTREIERATRRLEEDFRAVITNAELRESADMAMGWRADAMGELEEATAVAGEVALGSAWLSVSGAVRKLHQYEGTARLLAPSTREGFWPLWRLAESLHAAQWALLVRVGEAAYEFGAGNTETPFAPAREALAASGRQVVNALSTLLGLVPEAMPNAADILALQALRDRVRPSRCLHRVEEMERIVEAVSTLVTSEDSGIRRRLLGSRAILTAELEGIVDAVRNTPALHTDATLQLAAALEAFLGEVQRVGTLGRLVGLVVPRVLRSGSAAGVGEPERLARQAIDELLRLREAVRDRAERFAAEEDLDGAAARNELAGVAMILTLLDGAVLDFLESVPGAPRPQATGDFAVGAALAAALTPGDPTAADLVGALGGFGLLDTSNPAIRPFAWTPATAGSLTDDVVASVLTALRPAGVPTVPTDTALAQLLFPA